MPRRTMNAVCIWARKANKHGDGNEVDAGSLPKGDDLLDLVENHLEMLFTNRDLLRDDVKQRYACIDSVQRCGRTLIVEGGSGHFGEERRTNRDVDSHNVLYANEGADRDASLVDVRAMFFVPPVGIHAVMFNEKAPGAVLGSKLLASFAASWPDLYSDLTLKKETLVET